MGYEARKSDPQNTKAWFAMIRGWIRIGLLVVIAGIVLLVFIIRPTI